MPDIGQDGENLADLDDLIFTHQQVLELLDSLRQWTYRTPLGENGRLRSSVERLRRVRDYLDATLQLATEDG